MHNLDPAQVQVFPVRGAYANLIGSVAQLSTGAVKSIEHLTASEPATEVADHGFRGPKLNPASRKSPLPKPDVRQTANFEASGRSSSESTGQWQTWGSGSETKAPYTTGGEQRSLSAMPPKYELRWLAVPSPSGLRVADTG